MHPAKCTRTHPQENRARCKRVPEKDTSEVARNFQLVKKAKANFSRGSSLPSIVKLESCTGAITYWKYNTIIIKGTLNFLNQRKCALSVPYLHPRCMGAVHPIAALATLSFESYILNVTVANKINIIDKLVDIEIYANDIPTMSSEVNFNMILDLCRFAGNAHSAKLIISEPKAPPHRTAIAVTAPGNAHSAKLIISEPKAPPHRTAIAVAAPVHFAASVESSSSSSRVLVGAIGQTRGFFDADLYAYSSHDPHPLPCSSGQLLDIYRFLQSTNHVFICHCGALMPFIDSPNKFARERNRHQALAHIHNQFAQFERERIGPDIARGFVVTGTDWKMSGERTDYPTYTTWDENDELYKFLKQYQTATPEGTVYSDRLGLFSVQSSFKVNFQGDPLTETKVIIITVPDLRQAKDGHEAMQLVVKFINENSDAFIVVNMYSWTDEDGQSVSVKDTLHALPNVGLFIAGGADLPIGYYDNLQQFGEIPPMQWRKEGSPDPKHITVGWGCCYYGAVDAISTHSIHPICQSLEFRKINSDVLIITPSLMNVWTHHSRYNIDEYWKSKPRLRETAVKVGQPYEFHMPLYLRDNN